MSSSSSTSLSSPADGSSSPSSPLSALQQLKTELLYKSGKAVFEHCLGLSKLEDVSSLADNMIVVCFDLESWARDHSKLTEIGISTFDSRDMRALEAPGMHGEE